MKKINFHNLTPVFIITVSLLFFFSCKSTKYIPKDKYLLNKTKIITDNKTLKVDDINNYISQKPNSKVLGIYKFNLHNYNLLHTDKDKKWRNKLEDIIGEPPVVYDNYLTSKSIKQINLYLKNQGYFESLVKDSVTTKNKKIDVFYVINSKKPYLINKIAYNIEDPNIKKIVIKDSPNCKIKLTSIYNVDNFNDERARITLLLKNNGYFNFSKEYIYFEVDSSKSKKTINLTIGIKKFELKNYDNKIITENHKVYKINNVYVNINYDINKTLQKDTSYFNKLDTIKYDNVYFIKLKDYNFKYKVISSLLNIGKDSTYNFDNTNSTYNNIQNLQFFKFININYKECEKTNLPLLDCVINLSPFKKQSYVLEAEGTNSSGNLGAAENISYTNKSIFNGAEIVNIKFKTAIETQTILNKYSNDNIVKYLPFNTQEYQGNTSLIIPRFFFPLVSKNFVKKYHPKSMLNTVYNYQLRPDYTRIIYDMSFGYLWQTKNNFYHRFNPISVSSVTLKGMSLDFLKSFSNPYIRESYTDHLITVSNYGFTYSNQKINKQRNYFFIQSNIESSGNILYEFSKLTNRPLTKNNYYTFLNNRFAQYLKTDFDYRYNKITKNKNKIVYRFYFGIGYPYGNLKTLPFEKQFYSGGANSIRAWQVHTLGPGSYKDTLQIPMQSSDIKLETNLEYRFKLFWVINGALFIDAGNIWAINKIEDNESAMFRFNRFYKEIAIGTGSGLRFDFSFFILRFDLGIKVYEPQENLGKRLIITNRKYNSSDFQINIGIGYPF